MLFLRAVVVVDGCFSACQLAGTRINRVARIQLYKNAKRRTRMQTLTFGNVWRFYPSVTPKRSSWPERGKKRESDFPNGRSVLRAVYYRVFHDVLKSWAWKPSPHVSQPTDMSRVGPQCTAVSHDGGELTKCHLPQTWR